MGKYVKETPRISVKFIDTDTEETLFEISNRTTVDVGEIFANHIVTSLIETELKNKKLPKNIMVLAVGEYSLKQ